MKARRLTHIISYPIKSLGGITLDAAKLTQRGLEHDRRWMLVDERNHFLTIRQHPEFLFFELVFSDLGFRIRKREASDFIDIPLQLTSGEELRVKIWNDEVTAINASHEINNWFKTRLGYECKLVYLPESSPRRVQPEWVKEAHHVSFADGYPYLLLGSASVEDINSKVKEDITYERFRPNLYFDNNEPYEEFTFENIVIGESRIKCIKPCARCIVITYDPETGEQGKEPLKTLFKQRIDDKMVFGQNAIMLKEGIIKVGDEVKIETIKESPYAPVNFS